MKEQDNFCGKCGAALIKEPTNEFDTVTGKPLSRKVCPTGMCYHYGFDGHTGILKIVRPASILDKIFPPMWPKLECQKCGQMV